MQHFYTFTLKLFMQEARRRMSCLNAVSVDIRHFEMEGSALAVGNGGGRMYVLIFAVIINLKSMRPNSCSAELQCTKYVVTCSSCMM